MKRLSLLLSACCIALGIFLAAFVPAAWFSHPAQNAPMVSVEIPEQQSVGEIAHALVSRGVLVSTWGYRVYALLDGAARRAKPGIYRLSPGMSYHTIATTLSIGPERAQSDVQVIEGWDIRDIAEMLAKRNVDAARFLTLVGDQKTGSSFDASYRKDYPFLADLPQLATTLEGYLFPDTYRVYEDQLPEALIIKQLNAFAKREPALSAEAKKQGRTLRDVLILASIIEKEVSKPMDRRIVAGIFLNRLNQGMALQSDATVNFITQSGRSRSSLGDLATESLYNTYKHKGLPPGPISNPGDDALDAALHPTQSSYKYFLTDNAGKIYYAKTFEEHQANRVRAYGSR